MQLVLQAQEKAAPPLLVLQEQDEKSPIAARSAGAGEVSPIAGRSAGAGEVSPTAARSAGAGEVSPSTARSAGAGAGEVCSFCRCRRSQPHRSSFMATNMVFAWHHALARVDLKAFAFWITSA